MIVKRHGSAGVEHLTTGDQDKTEWALGPEAINAIEREKQGRKKSHGKVEPLWAMVLKMFPIVGKRT